MTHYKKIPYGISNFAALIEQNYYYVDKTRYIEVLESLSEKYISYLRPRRFGKSLFVSMLNNYYDVAQADSFETLFGRNYIGKNPTPLRNSYYVLDFDFSGVNVHNLELTYKDFTNKVKSSLERCISRYNLNFDLNQNDASPNGLLTEFFSKAEGLTKKKFFVLIDEYDHFTSELLGYNKPAFDEIVSKSGYFRKFFEVLKTATATIIDRIFFTGVNPLTLDSLTSGFNISSNLTLSPLLHEMMGFNEEEIKELFLYYNIKGKELDHILPMLKNHYDGYVFVDEPQNHLYNSDMVLYFAKDYIQYGKPPKNLIDENIASSYEKIKRFIQLGDVSKNLAFISDLLEGNNVDMSLTTRFEITQKFTLDDFKSLFFYMGLITIRRSDFVTYSVKIPNYVIRELYFTFFESIISEQIDYHIDSTSVAHAVAEIARNGNINDLIKLTEITLTKLSNRDFIRFDEKYVKLIMLTYLFQSKIYYIKTEYEIHRGYIDIALLPRINVKVPHHAIIELKYISKENYNEKLLKQKISDAKTQLQGYSQSEELSSIPSLLKYIIVFSGSTCIHHEQIKLFN